MTELTARAGDDMQGFNSDNIFLPAGEGLQANCTARAAVTSAALDSEMDSGSE